MKYKLRGCIIGLFWLFTLLLQGQVAWAETLTVKGTGQDLFYVYDTTGKQLDYARTNGEIELFPGTYTVGLHGTIQTANVQAGQKAVLVAGIITTSGIGQDLFYVYDTTGKQLDYARTNGEIELFPGTYTVGLHGTIQTANVQAGQKTVSAAGRVTTSGTGQDLFYVYDTTGKQLDYARTNGEIELFPGTYTVGLHGTIQTANVQAGQKTVSAAGIITTSGTGQDLFYVYDTTGKQLDYARTNGEIELFPGTYTVGLHGTIQTANVQAGQKTVSAAGRVTTSGTGQDLFYVYDTTGKQLDYARTNGEIELFPGTYTVGLHGTIQTANVQAAQKTILVAGILRMPGNGQDLFYVYDSTGKQLDYASTNSEIELFPGTYTVKLNGSTQTVVVQADTPSTQPTDTTVTDSTTSTTTTPPVVKPCGCKKLPPPNATDATGKSVTTATVTYAGIVVNNQSPVVEVKQKLSDTVEVVGDIEVDPVDVGQHVDIFIYAVATFPGVSTVSYYMLGPGLTIMAWDQHPASLVAFSSGTLGVFQTVQMYSGKFVYPGTLKVYFGYRLPNGIVITSSVPIDITIEQ